MAQKNTRGLLECKKCNRQFATAAALAEHSRAKHGGGGAGLPRSQLKRNGFILLTVLVTVFAAYNILSATPSSTISIGGAGQKIRVGFASPPASSYAGPDLPTMYYFAFQCAACHETNLAMERIISTFAGKLNFRVVDVTKDPETNSLAQRLGVQSVPALVLTDKNGRILTTLLGEARYEQILDLIKKYYGL